MDSQPDTFMQGLSQQQDQTAQPAQTSQSPIDFFTQLLKQRLGESAPKDRKPGFANGFGAAYVMLKHPELAHAIYTQVFGPDPEAAAGYQANQKQVPELIQGIASLGNKQLGIDSRPQFTYGGNVQNFDPSQGVSLNQRPAYDRSGRPVGFQTLGVAPPQSGVVSDAYGNQQYAPKPGSVLNPAQTIQPPPSNSPYGGNNKPQNLQPGAVRGGTPTGHGTALPPKSPSSQEMQRQQSLNSLDLAERNIKGMMSEYDNVQAQAGSGSILLGKAMEHPSVRDIAGRDAVTQALGMGQSGGSARRHEAFRQALTMEMQRVEGSGNRVMEAVLNNILQQIPPVSAAPEVAHPMYQKLLEMIHQTRGMYQGPLAPGGHGQVSQPSSGKQIRQADFQRLSPQGQQEALADGVQVVP
jgi:hypothetical protein